MEDATSSAGSDAPPEDKVRVEIRTVFVRNLPYETTHEQLQEAFEDVGPVRSAFIIASGADDAAAAVKECHNKKKIGGRVVKVELAKRKKKDKQKKTTAPQPLGSKGTRKRCAANRKADMEPARKRKKSKAKEVKLSRSVIVKGIPPKATQKEVSKMLRKFGKVALLVMPAPESSEDTQAARVLFDKLEAADACVRKMQGKTLLGAILDVSFLAEKAARVIVRNLSFKSTEAVLKEFCRPFGNVLNVNLPLGPGGRPKGFGFVQFSNLAEANAAITQGNGSKLRGRMVAIDWVLPQSRYQSAVAVEKEHRLEHQDEKETVEDIPMDEDSGSESSGDSDGDGKERSEEESEEESEEDAEEEEDRVSEPERRDPSRASFDVQRGKTIHIRNLPFTCSEAELAAFFSQYGEVKLAKIVIDKQFNRPKGTGFVQFVHSDSAQAVLDVCGVGSTPDPVAKEEKGKKRKKKLDLLPITGGIVMGGRPLTIALAVDRARAGEFERKNEKVREDKRNLYLAREGYINPESDVAKELSKADLAKRQAAWKEKGVKLKNPNFFVSKVRLSVRNLPLAMEEKQLRTLFLEGAREADLAERPTVKQVKIVRDEDRVNAAGVARSKRFGFVEFTRHEHALAALRALNNNPHALKSNKQHRLMVEFALDDMRRLQAREKLLVRKRQKQQVQTSLDKDERGNGGVQSGGAQRGSTVGQKKCFNCKAVGHRAKDCPKPRSRFKKVPNAEANIFTSERHRTGDRCHRCDKSGHKARACPGRKKAGPRSNVRTTTISGVSDTRRTAPKRLTRSNHTGAEAVRWTDAKPVRREAQRRTVHGTSAEPRGRATQAQTAVRGRSKRKQSNRDGSNEQIRRKRNKRDVSDDFDALVDTYTRKMFGGDGVPSVKNRWFNAV